MVKIVRTIAIVAAACHVASADESLMLAQVQAKRQYKASSSSSQLNDEPKADEPVSVSAVAVKVRKSANQVATQMAHKFDKPIVVIKDLLAQTAENREHLFDSLKGQKIVVQHLDGTVKVMNAASVEQIGNFIKNVNTKTDHNLKEILKSKNAECDNCSREAMIKKIVDTWDWAAKTVLGSDDTTKTVEQKTKAKELVEQEAKQKVDNAKAKQQAAEKPAEKQAEKHTEQPAEKKAEKHEEKQAEKHEEKQAEKPAEKNAEKPAEKKAEKHEEKHVHASGSKAEKSNQKTVDEVMEEPQEINAVAKAVSSVFNNIKGLFGKGDEEPKHEAGLLQQAKAHVVHEEVVYKEKPDALAGKLTTNTQSTKAKSVPSKKHEKHEKHEKNVKVETDEKHAKKHDKKETAEHNLPALKQVMGKSTQVLTSLNTQMEELKESLATAEKDSKNDVRAEKAAYEKKLREQHVNTTGMQARNKKVSTEVSELKQETAGLRRKGDRLKAQSAVLRNSLESLQNNISTAQDFITGALVSKEEDTDKLSILHELDANDTHKSMEKAHKQSLLAVVGDPMEMREMAGLLQTEVEQPSPDAAEYVRSLGARFEELEIEQNASMTELKQSFDSEWAREEKLQQMLEKEHESLQESKATESELRHRLHGAVVHLQETKTYLESRVGGLQTYAARVSKLMAKQ